MGYPSAPTSTARVTIFVGDVNDNQPNVNLLRSNSSCLTVPADTMPGTVVRKIYAIDVTKISAIDEDAEFNSEVMYSVATPEPVRSTASFNDDSRSGNITIAEQLVQKD